MKVPAQAYAASDRAYKGLPELTYPLHDRDVIVIYCGRECMHRKKINMSTVLAGQRLGIKEVDDGIWLVSFMHYHLGYIDLEQRTLQTLDTRSARGCHPCFRNVLSPMCPGWTNVKLKRAKGLEPSTSTLARLVKTCGRIRLACHFAAFRRAGSTVLTAVLAGMTRTVQST